MRNWCSRHPVWFMALYALFYLSFFALLERTIQTPDLWVHCQLDDLIPFCKYAIVPYILWFPWIPFTLFYLLYKAPREDFWRLCIPLFTGMTMTLLFYAIVPNGLALRPKYVPGTDIFAQLVRMIYRSDTPMNVCPSIHVFNSVTLMLAYYRSAIFDAPRRRWMRPAAMVLKEIPNAQIKNVLSAQCCRQDVFRYSAYTRMPTKIIASAASFLGFIFSWKIVTPKIVT